MIETEIGQTPYLHGGMVKSLIDCFFVIPNLYQFLISAPCLIKIKNRMDKKQRYRLGSNQRPFG